MAKIGRMTARKTSGGADYFEGEISLAGYKGEFGLVVNEDANSERAPDWLACEPRMPGGLRCEFGKAWEGKGKDTGRRYLDFVFDGPSFDKPARHIRAFERTKDGEAGAWDIVYQRPDPAKGQGAGQGAAGAGGGGNDEIPF